LQKNKEGVPVDSIEPYAEEADQNSRPSLSFENAVGQDSLNRFDRKKGSRKSNQRRGKRKPHGKRKTT
jgi:hypothetical protein